MVDFTFTAISFLLSATAHAQTFKAMSLDGGGHTSGFAKANNGRLYT